MNPFEGGPKPSQPETKNLQRLTREGVEARLTQGENLENFDLHDLDLAGLNLENVSFRGSDIRGLTLYKEKKNGERITANIKGTNWTDATVADVGAGALFARVEAEKAIFGFSESIDSRRKKIKALDHIPFAYETGQFQNFNGNGGNFKNTKWTNIDFGGDAEGGLEATFFQANLTSAVFQACDFSYLDFSETKIEKVKIIDPISLKGLTISSEQVSSLIGSIELTNESAKNELDNEIATHGTRQALENFFEIKII